MNKFIHSNINNFGGHEYRFDIYTADDFSSLRDITQVYGILLNKEKDKMIVVRNKQGLWLLPGGSIEKGETLLDTLVREAKEETNRDLFIDSARPFYYQKTYKKVGNKWVFGGIQVRFTVLVSKDNEFISDPDNGDIVETKWINITDISNYLDWGVTADFIKTSLITNNI